MDYKYIEQLMERYWNAETTLEEESILRSFFRQENIPAEMEPLRALFADEASRQQLGDDFDARILEMIGKEEAPKVVKAREVSLTRRMMPLFKAAAVIAIILTIGGALQAPWDNNWNTPQDYARFQQDLDSVAAVSPIQAENMSDNADSTSILMERPKN
ncbi:MAG: pyruvate ferredoxin oxidoreductase [Prevotella sp.]|nr:pyruvate ferredoxin oxidoreductase [Prevotella sp.]